MGRQEERCPLVGDRENFRCVGRWDLGGGREVDAYWGEILGGGCVLGGDTVNA